MKIRHLIIFAFISLTLASCVSSKKFKTQVAKYDSLKLAFRFTAIGTVFWIISLALFSLSRANVQVTVGH